MALFRMEMPSSLYLPAIPSNSSPDQSFRQNLESSSLSILSLYTREGFVAVVQWLKDHPQVTEDARTTEKGPKILANDPSAPRSRTWMGVAPALYSWLLEGVHIGQALVYCKNTI